MKKITLLALLLSAAALRPAAAQTAITLAAARAQAPTTNATVGATVTVRGIVTNGTELGAIRYMQDGTGGIGAYGAGAGTLPTVSNALNALVPGDSVQITGTLKQFYGLLEIDPITNVTLLAGNRPVPAPVVFTAANMTQAFAEQYEGQLVRFNGITSINTTGGAAVTAFSSISAGYRINNSAATPLYINAASIGPYGLVGKPAPTGTYDAVGILAQHQTGQNSGPVNTTSGYQLLPRLYADFIQAGTPNFIQDPVPSNLSTTGFTVNFLTQNAGDTQLLYGLTPTGPFQPVSSPALTTTHALAITGLTPATVYYVQAVSANAVGRSQSRVIPMITASLSTGKIRTYFNTPVNTGLSLPNNNATYLRTGAIADTLARYIGLAQNTLDLAIYNWGNNAILTAVNAAKARGVVVRVIYEDDNSNFSVAGLASGISSVGRPAQPGSSGSAIMHNKFVVIDAGSPNPNVPWVWTGSTNWTAAQLATDRNSALAVQDQGLAKTYTMEFEEMWGGTGATPGAFKFGNLKTDNTPHYFLIGGRRVESFFSPTDNVNARLIETVQTADNDLHFASMLVTRSDIARSIRDQINLRRIGSCSEGLTNDTSNTDGSGNSFRVVKSAIGGRMMLDNISGIMHHKYLIVDAGLPTSDPTVFVGSHNWTNSAETNNDENTLVIHDAAVTNQYYQEYARRVADQNRGIAVCTFALATRAGTVPLSTMQAYPNPAHGSVNLRLAAPGAHTATVLVRDATGRVVSERTQSFDGTSLTVDATTLKAGLYLIQVTTPETVQTSRVVVE